MPKKFGINSKSEEARERQAEVKKNKREHEEKVKEDKLWVDDDKSLKAKEDRKRENLDKKQKEKERKEENKRLADEELEKYAKKNNSNASTKKTRAQIEEARIAAIASMQAQLKKEQADKEKELEDNLNEDINPNHLLRAERMKYEERGAIVVEGSGLDEAVDLIEEEKMFKHPEKKVKQAWNEYVEENLAAAKRQNPSLKRSQLLHILHKEFEKSDKNPFNLKFVDYNTKIN